jgi:competence protein ComEC
MKWLLTPLLLFSHWYYTPLESPSKPVEIDSIDFNLNNNELAFTFFTLSDGESALIQHPGGDNVLINTGGQDTMKELQNILTLYQIKKINTVILTNDGDCCISNLKKIINQYGVKKIISGTSAQPEIHGIENELNSVDYHALSVGSTQEIAPGTMVEVLYDQQGMNLSFSFLNRRVLWMNYPDEESQVYLPKSAEVETTIMKLPSKAREQFISEQLMEQLDPQLAILFRNKNEKINDELLEQLHHAWVRVYYNRDSGALSVKFTKDNYEIFKISDQKK